MIQITIRESSSVKFVATNDEFGVREEGSNRAEANCKAMAACLRELSQRVADGDRKHTEKMFTTHEGWTAVIGVMVGTKTIDVRFDIDRRTKDRASAIAEAMKIASRLGNEVTRLDVVRAVA